MLAAVIMGWLRSCPGRLTMRSRTRCLRWLRSLRFRSRVFLRLLFGDSLGIVAVTRKPPRFGIVRMCSHLHYSRIFGGFRVFFEILTSMVYISRLVQD